MTNENNSTRPQQAVFPDVIAYANSDEDAAETEDDYSCEMDGRRPRARRLDAALGHRMCIARRALGLRTGGRVRTDWSYRVLFSVRLSCRPLAAGGSPGAHFRKSDQAAWAFIPHTLSSSIIIPTLTVSPRPVPGASASPARATPMTLLRPLVIKFRKW